MSLKGRAAAAPIVASALMLAAMAHGQALNADAPPTPAANARAQMFTYGVDAGIGETDNVTLASTDKVSQTIAITDADLDLKEQSRLFDVDAKGAFSYLDYLQNAYGNQLIGRFDGTAQASIVPERITWALQESFGQAQIDPFAAATPTNLENVNYVSTGPDFALRFGPTYFLDLTARYARTTYQSEPFDSNRLLGSAAFGLALSPQSNISLDATFTRVLFDNTIVNTDFDRSSAYGQYDAHGARTDLLVNLGVTKVDQGAESLTGPDAKLQLSRKLSSASKLTFTFERNITDASTGFATLQSGAIGGIVTGPAALSLSNYTVTYGLADWEYARNRTTFGLSGSWEKDSYDGQPLQDLTHDTAQFRIDRRLSSVLSVQLIGSLYRIDYTNIDYTETDELIGASMTFREGRGLEIRLRCDHINHNVSGNNTGYSENRAFLTIGYRPRPAQPT